MQILPKAGSHTHICRKEFFTRAHALPKIFSHTCAMPEKLVFVVAAGKDPGKHTGNMPDFLIVCNVSGNA